MTWLVVIVAAVAGAFLRAVTSEQKTWCWQSVIDTAMGGVASVVVWLLLGILPWTAATVVKLDTLMEQGLSVLLLGYVSGHVWVNRGADWLAALGDKLTGRA
jgi:hypothetical protein